MLVLAFTSTCCWTIGDYLIQSVHTMKLRCQVASARPFLYLYLQVDMLFLACCKRGDPVYRWQHFSSSWRSSRLWQCDCQFVKVVSLVGKIRKRWLRETVSETGVEMLRAIKQQTDPQNIFGCGNVIPWHSQEYLTICLAFAVCIATECNHVVCNNLCNVHCEYHWPLFLVIACHMWLHGRLFCVNQ